MSNKMTSQNEFIFDPSTTSVVMGTFCYKKHRIDDVSLPVSLIFFHSLYKNFLDFCSDFEREPREIYKSHINPINPKQIPNKSHKSQISQANLRSDLPLGSRRICTLSILISVHPVLDYPIFHQNPGVKFNINISLIQKNFALEAFHMAKKHISTVSMDKN